MRLRETEEDGVINLVDGGTHDEELATSVKQNDSGELDPRFRSDEVLRRAETLVPKFTELSREKLEELIRRVTFLRQVCFLVIVFVAVLLGFYVKLQSSEISLGSVLSVVVFQIVGMAASFILMIPRREPWKVPPIEWVKEWIKKRINKRCRNGQNIYPESASIQPVTERLFEFTRSQPAFTWAIQTTFHGAWFWGGVVTWVCILLVFVGIGSSRDFDFYHRSNITVDAGLKWTVDTLSVPLEWGPTEKPNRDDFYYLFHGRGNPETGRFQLEKKLSETGTDIPSDTYRPGERRSMILVGLNTKGDREPENDTLIFRIVDRRERVARYASHPRTEMLEQYPELTKELLGWIEAPEESEELDRNGRHRLAAKVRWFLNYPIVDRRSSRHNWSVFMLLVIAVYWVLPRGLLWRVSGRQTRKNLTALDPCFQERYFSAVEDRLLLKDVPQAESEIVNDEDFEPPGANDRPEVISDEVPKEGPDSSRSLVLSYKQKPPDEGWLDLLPEDHDSKDMGDVSRSWLREEDEFRRELRTNVSLLVAVFDMYITPDGELERFLKTACREVSDTCRVFAVLTNGEAVRDRYDGDEGQIREWTDTWRTKLGQWGIAGERIYDAYDHFFRTAQSHERLLEFLTDPSLPVEQRAGRFERAAQLIGGALREVEKLDDEEKLKDCSLGLMSEIRSLYSRQASVLEKVAADVVSSDPSVAAVATRLEEGVSKISTDAEEKLTEIELKRMAGVFAHVSQHLKELSPGWAATGALLGIGIPMVVLGPVSAVPLFTASIIGGGLGAAHVPFLYRRGIARVLGESEFDANDASAGDGSDQVAVVLTDVFRQSVLLSLILEMQGLSEDRIARNLKLVLNETNEGEIESAAEGVKVLGGIQNALARHLPLEIDR